MSSTVGPDVAPLVGDVGEGGERIERANRARRPEQLLGVGGDVAPHLGEEIELEARDALLGAEDAALVLLQLDGHVALGPDERLAPQVLGRHLGGVGVADLERVAEDPVEAHAQAANAGARALALLEGGDPVLGQADRLAELAQLGIPSLADQSALPQHQRRLVLERLLEELGEPGGRHDVVGDLATERGVDGGQLFAERGESGEEAAQGYQVARVGHAERGPARQPLEIAHAAKARRQRRPQRRVLDERGDGILAPGDDAEIERGAQQPLAEQPRSHRRLRPVERADQRAASRAVLRGLQQLERRHRGGIEQHGVSGDEALKAGQVGERLPLGVAEVGEDAARRLHARGHRARAVQGGRAELCDQDLARAPRGEPSRIADGHRDARRLAPAQPFRLAAPRDQDLGRAPQERRFDQDLGAVARRLAHPELARRDVDEGHAEGAGGAGEREEEVVGGAFEELGVGDRAGRDDADDLASHELLALGGRLHLLAHRHLASRADEPRDVAVGGVVGDARHRDRALALLARRERELEQPGRGVGVLVEELVEVAEAEEQQVVRVATLQLPVLPHHRGQLGRGVPHEASAAASRS